MTLGSINQCRHIEVYTREKGADWLFAELDLDAVEKERSLAPRASAETLQAVAALQTRPDAEGRLVRKVDPFFSERWPFRSDDRWAELAAVTCPVLVVRDSTGAAR